MVSPSPKIRSSKPSRYRSVSTRSQPTAWRTGTHSPPASVSTRAATSLEPHDREVAVKKQVASQQSTLSVATPAEESRLAVPQTSALGPAPEGGWEDLSQEPDQQDKIIPIGRIVQRTSGILSEGLAAKGDFFV